MESWFMRLLLVAVVIGLALGWPPASSAQTGQPAPTNMAVRVTESARPMRPWCASTAGPASRRWSIRAGEGPASWRGHLRPGRPAL